MRESRRSAHYHRTGRLRREMNRLRRFDAALVADGLEPERMESFIREAPGDIAYLQQILTEAEQELERRDGSDGSPHTRG